VEPPPEWTASNGLAAPEAYLVVDEAFSATLQPATRVPGRPQVVLADYHVAWQPDGSVRGVAGFDLEPSGNRECPLLLPAGYHLVQALMNGVPALVATDASGRWWLTLGSDELPQRVEVLFDGALPPATWGRQRLPVPTLGDVPVERSLWTIRGPAGAQLPESLASQRIGLLGQDLLRLQTIDRLASLVRTQADQRPQSELAAWYRPWAARHRQYRAALQRETLLSPRADVLGNVSADLSRIDQNHAQIAREAGLRDSFARTVSAESTADQPQQFWQFAFDGPQPPFRLMLPGRSEEVELHRQLLTASHWPLRLGAAVGLALLSGLLFLLFRSPWWQALDRWRYVAGAACGLAWWLWLSPSVLGLLIVALSLVAALRDRRPQSREAGSAIVRLGSG
jgi:hypothetical protein